MTALGIVCPPVKLRLDASGLGDSHGNTVTNPGPEGPVTVTFSTAAEALGGDSGPAAQHQLSGRARRQQTSGGALTVHCGLSGSAIHQPRRTSRHEGRRGQGAWAAGVAKEDAIPVAVAGLGLEALHVPRAIAIRQPDVRARRAFV